MFCHLALPDLATGGVGYAFTDRSGGVSAEPMGPLNLGRSDLDDINHVRENFERVRAAIGVRRVVTLRQVHSADVVVVDDELLARWGPSSHLGSSYAGQLALPVADALVTRAPDVALAVRVADCLPVLLADAEAGVVAAAHAGRTGLFAGILPRTVAAMTELGARRVTAVVGPHVCGGCYEVPQEMVDELSPGLPATRAVTSWGTPALDLAAGAVDQLERLGCRVLVLDACTRTDPDLHSHRRDGAGAGRLAGLVWRVAGVATR